VLKVDPDATGLPRSAVRDALSDGADLVLEFSVGRTPCDAILREVAILVRRLRTAGISLSIHGLANSVRCRISRLEASLGRS